VPLLLGPAPESADDRCDLLACSRRALAPEVDDVAQVVDGDVDRLLVGERDAHAREDCLVVAERRRSGAVLVAEPAQVATDELAERRRAVGLVLHRLADDAGGLTERQARVMAVRLARAIVVDEGLGQRRSGDCRRVPEEHKLRHRFLLILVQWARYAKLAEWHGAVANHSPITRHPGSGSG
jgi:hypothetical protein